MLCKGFYHNFRTIKASPSPLTPTKGLYMPGPWFALLPIYPGTASEYGNENLNFKHYGKNFKSNMTCCLHIIPAKRRLKSLLSCSHLLCSWRMMMILGFPHESTDPKNANQTRLYLHGVPKEMLVRGNLLWRPSCHHVWRQLLLYLSFFFFFFFFVAKPPSIFVKRGLPFSHGLNHACIIVIACCNTRQKYFLQIVLNDRAKSTLICILEVYINLH